uniref:Head-tail adaptor protein n=1 Tax=candidate division WOR-3 bacterium TaxID=2052148 RepID=A0A7C6A811_UNCW3
MLTEDDKKFIVNTSEEIITGSGEKMIRRRLKTNLPPHSYDSDFGETVKSTEDQYEDLEFTGKVFFKITERVAIQVFGAVIQADAIIHIPIKYDVIASDLIYIRGVQYRILELKEAPLQGFNAARLERI